MTMIRTALFTTSAFAALACSASTANAISCRSGETKQVMLRFPTSAAPGVVIPGVSLDVKSESCVQGSKDSFTVDGMPGTFTSAQNAADFVKVAIGMKNFGMAFASTEELAKAIAHVLTLEEKYQAVNKTR